MGCLVSAPLRCLSGLCGSCLGGCCAEGCCELVRMEEAAVNSKDEDSPRWLLWLQWVALAWAATCKLALSQSTLGSRACNFASTLWPGLDDVGICACQAADDPQLCMSNVLAGRILFSASFTFALILLLVSTSCRTKVCTPGPFVVFFLFSVVSLLFPTASRPSESIAADVCIYCGAFAFLLAMSIAALDGAYQWNEIWVSPMVRAFRAGRKGCHNAWRAVIVVVAILLLLLSGGLVAASFLSLRSFSCRAAELVEAVTALILVNFAISVTEWCEHGSLLTSCAMAFYHAWLLSEARLSLKEQSPPDAFYLPQVALGVQFVCFALFMMTLLNGTFDALLGFAVGTPASMRPFLSEPLSPSERLIRRQKHRIFCVHCGVHASIPLYIVFALFTSEYSAVPWVLQSIVAPGLYLWSLVAPKVLPQRQFR